MKCPVCDLENSTMLCSQCGFDASRDYERYPSFGPVGRMPSVSAKRKQWLDSQKKPMSSSDGPQFVDYRKMVTQAAEEDLKKRTSQEHKLMLELQFARDQISTLKREQKILTDSLIPENKSLKKRIKTLFDQNNALIKESVQMEDKVRDLVTKLVEADRLHQDALKRVSNLERKNNVLAKDLKQSEDYRIASSRQYGNEVIKVRQRDTEIAELKSKLETAQGRIAELEAALEAERNKGVLSRLFNR